MKHPDRYDPRRVAVIAVHGVADQMPGATAQAVVELLVASAPTPYQAIATEAFTLPVPPLPPVLPGARKSLATPTGSTRPWFKALLQSTRSDFQRDGWEAPASVAAMRRTNQAHDAPASGLAAAFAPVPRGQGPVGVPSDRGLAATNFLLSKAIENNAPHEVFESTRVRLARAGAPAQVDVYEMYWADLSRLSGAIPRIVTELFTMVFRLSKLGRETVDEARGQMRKPDGTTPTAWQWFANTQIALDWAFVNGLALLFAQLGLLGLTIVVFGAAAAQAAMLRFAVGFGVLFVSLLWLVYRWRDRALRRLVPAGLATTAAVMVLWPPSAFWILGLFWLAAVTLAFDAALRVADDRFPLTRFVGLAMWAVTLFLVLGGAISHARQAPSLDAWVQAALVGAEVALDVLRWWWVVAAPLFVVWLVSGTLAARTGGYRGAGSVATGRLGFFASLGSFVMLTMALWALLSTVLDLSVAGVAYTPQIFAKSEVIEGTSVAANAAAACPLHPEASGAGAASALAGAAAATGSRGAAASATPAASAASTAQAFLRTRYEDSTSFFSLVAMLLILLVVYLAAMFLPSVLAELTLLRSAGADAARRLGRWLTAGYRRLDGAVLAVVGMGIVFAAFVGYVLKFGQASLATSPPLTTAMDCVAFVSQSTLKPLVLGAASIAAALTALGGLLSRYVPGLRAPLDIALDVDNYFREFPRKAIPRARIFSRYKALLDHVATQGYERVVIVAHSQGTVISAELLRFLSSAPPGDTDDGDGRRRRLSAQLGGNVHLLTLGCPLRQLYAARFPSLYPWVLAAHPGGNGPEAADIGVERWANAFTSGDYVGRWLWSSPTLPDDALGHPMTDTLDPPVLGRADAYAFFDPMPPDAAAFAAARQFDICLGFGAHTHYFEPDQHTVAWLIDHLIA